MAETGLPQDPQGSIPNLPAPVAELAPPVSESDATISEKAKRSTFWTILDFGGSQFVRFAGSLVLTRIFAPEVFGLSAILDSFNVALVLFTDVGLHQNIVHSERGDDPVFLNTAWTIGVLRGIALWVIAAIASVPIARSYHLDLLSPQVLGAYAALLLVSGFNSTKISQRHRRMEFGAVTLIDLGCQVLTFVVTVVVAENQQPEPTIWAMVIGALAGAALKMILSHLFLDGVRNKFQWEKTAASSLFHFGKWITVSTIIHYFGEQAQPFIFGAVVPLALLGNFKIGNTFAVLASTVSGALAYDVTFALYSRVRRDSGDIAAVYRRCHWLILLASGWILSGLCAGGPTIVKMLFDDRYVDAGVILSILAVGSWFTSILNVNGAALLALGKPAWNIFPALAKLIAMAGLIPLGFHFGDFPGAVAGLAASDFIKYLTSTTATAIAGLREWGHDLMLTLLFAGSTFVAWLAVQGLHAAGLPELHSRPAAILEAVVIFVIVTVAWLPFGWPEIRRYVLEHRKSP